MRARFARLRRGATTRVRLLGLFVLIMGIALAVGLFAQRALLLREVMANVDAELRQEVEELGILSTGSSPTTGEPFGPDVRAIFDTFLRRNVPADAEGVYTLVEGQPYASSPSPYQLLSETALVERWAALRAPEQADVDTPAGRVRYLAVPVTHEEAVQGTFIAAVFLDQRTAVVGDVIRTGALTWGAALVMASAAAWFAARRVLQPIDDLSEAARSVSESNWRERIHVEGDDQIAFVARTFNEMLDRLEAAFAAQRRLIDDAGHELRTPITVIRGHLELMPEEPEQRAATLRIVQDELDGMARMVEDLLLLARAEQVGFLHLQPVDLQDLVEGIAQKARMLDGSATDDPAPGDEGDRGWTITERAPAVVIADEHRLTQAMMNLCRNAVEHTPAGTEVSLGCSLVGGRAMLWVEDRGPGIPIEEQARIFDRFARGEDAERTEAGRRREGAGLGLAITQAIAEAHGGTVTVDSEPGLGARFTIVIPSGLDPDEADEGDLDPEDPDEAEEEALWFAS